MVGLPIIAMNPDRHSPAPGSSAYYAIRFAPRRHRQALRALYEILRAIDNVHREITDPGVAATKLNWWRNELGLGAEGTAQHPAVLRLQAQIAQSDHPCWIALQNFTDTALSGAQQSRYLDEAALLRQVNRAAGSVAQAVASVLAPNHEAPAATLGATAAASSLVRMLQRLGRDARQGYLYVPINDLQRFGVKAHEILQIRSGLQQEARFQSLMRHQAERARAHLAQARSSLAQLPPPLRRFNAIMLAHSSELLSALEAAEFAVLTQHISLTPLRKLWLAWSTR